jgi:hypothetical protein
MNESVGLQKAAQMLNITVSSLMFELKKPDCPYGFAYKENGKSTAYFVSKKALEQWIENNPQKYHNHPDYISCGGFNLRHFSTYELLEELKARCAV